MKLTSVRLGSSTRHVVSLSRIAVAMPERCVFEGELPVTVETLWTRMVHPRSGVGERIPFGTDGCFVLDVASLLSHVYVCINCILDDYLSLFQRTS